MSAGDEEEADMMSEAGEYVLPIFKRPQRHSRSCSFADDLDIFVPEEEAAQQDIFGAPPPFVNMFQPISTDVNPRDGDAPMFWHGMVRSGRRRGGKYQRSYGVWLLTEDCFRRRWP